MELRRALDQAVRAHVLGSKFTEWPGGCFGGGTDDELSTGAKQGSSSFDDRGWRSEAAGGYKIGRAPISLAFTEALSSNVDNVDTR